MKTTLRSNAKFFLVTAGLWLLLLISCPQSAVAQTNTFPASGDAGIGTTSPTEKLEVVGTVKSSGGVTITGAPGEPSYLNALYLGMTGNTATIDAVDQMVDFRDLVISAKTFRVNTWNGGSLVTGLFQNNNGSVGIGTTAPGYRLDVQGGQINSSAGLCIAGDCKTAWSQVGGGGSSQWTTTGANIYFNSGNVGVGTAAPGYLLDVQGNAQWVARFRKTDSTNGGIIVEAAAGYNPNLALSVNGATKWYINSNTSNGDTLQFWESTGATPRFTLTQGGRVGIGTPSPLQKFQIGSNTSTGTTTPDAISLGATYSTTAGANPKLRLFDNNAGAVYGLGVSESEFDFIIPTGSRYSWNINGVEQMRLDTVGNVSIAGNLTAGGTINAKYQDVAEWVPASHALPVGTVVTLDPTKSNHVEASSQAYDTRVAGVVSEQPGITLGEGGENKVLVATTGRVRVTVDASRAAIHIGDLLVTSDITGVAMKSEPITIGGRQIHSPGTLIGKALEPLEQGSGKILVLLSLQ